MSSGHVGTLSWAGYNAHGDPATVREIRRLVEFEASRKVDADTPPSAESGWHEGYKAGYADGLSRHVTVAEAERESCATQLDALGCDHCASALRIRKVDAEARAALPGLELMP